MASGKSLDIYKIYDNYKRQGKQVVCLVPSLVGEIKSRISELRVPSILVHDTSDIEIIVARYLPNCVLVEEAQFLRKEHILQLTKVVDIFNIPVIAYGLKNTYQNTLFEGAYWLLVYADKIEEIKTVCYFCDSKATMVLRLKDGEPTYEGPEISLKGEEGVDYFPTCRRCYRKPNLNKILGRLING